MRPSQEVRIKTLHKHIPYDYLIENISLLDSSEAIQYERTEEHLLIQLADKPEGDLPVCFKIEIG